VLIDPFKRGTGPYTAVKPLRVSPDGRLLLYEVKQGGERTGTFELFDIEKQEILPDNLSRGYLRGFAFSPDYKSFYYVHEATDSARPNYRAAYKHVLGTDLAEDGEAFFAGESERIRLHIIPGTEQMGLLVVHFSERTIIDFYLASLESIERPEPVIKNAEYRFGPTILADGRVLAITDYKAPNFRIVEVSPNEASEPDFRDVVPELDSPIQSWAVISDRVFVAYFRNLKTEVRIFDFSGKQLGQVPVDAADTIRLLPNGGNSDDLFFERESFTKPAAICSFSPASSEVVQWASRQIPFDSAQFDHLQVWFRSKDGTEIPMYLVGSRDVLERGQHPVIMTSYGGYGVSMTPQFSVFVAFLLERDCVFALPNIRGGSEYGIQWHEAAKRQKRQTAFDDFLSAAEWLITTGRTTPGRLALFGGSNSALLVAAAMTQRPDSFRAVVCMAPMLDMLRYHLFDNAHVWKDEFGTADDPEDFAALFRYSPYHNVHNGAEYPATMIISGDADQNCNPLHARKMAARLQAANGSDHQIILDYSRYRGHSPVLPLSERIESLTDRMAFLCDQLALQV
jgi:prolyl oligopeptidase